MDLKKPQTNTYIFLSLHLGKSFVTQAFPHSLKVNTGYCHTLSIKGIKLK